MIKNLLLKLGADATRTFQFYYGLQICCAASGTTATPLTQIEITPIDVDIPSGFTLDFDCKVRPVTNAITPAGSRTVAIAPYVGTLKKDSKCLGPAHDLTGHAFRLSLGKTFADGTARVVTATVLNNTVTCDIPAALLVGLDANATYETLPSTFENDVFNDYTAFESKVYKLGYPWNLENVFGGKVRRSLEGKVFLLADVV
ncbi:MAG: hypothetical protein ACRC4J_03575 [Cetobacterium sp.]